jgi:hypothetical protein
MRAVHRALQFHRKIEEFVYLAKPVMNLGQRPSTAVRGIFPEQIASRGNV